MLLAPRNCGAGRWVSWEKRGDIREVDMDQKAKGEI